MELVFKKGDIIEYCDEYYKVLIGGERFGTVIECDEDGDIYPDSCQRSNFYWSAHGRDCKLVEITVQCDMCRYNVAPNKLRLHGDYWLCRDCRENEIIRLNSNYPLHY